MASSVLSQDLWLKIQAVDGWLTREEADLLHGLCQGTWCEVGAWMGKSTLALAGTGYPGWVVDWFRGSPEHDKGTWTLPEYAETMRDYENVTTIVGSFDRVFHAIPNNLTLLHLDADHSYEATALAFSLYGPKVLPGGHVVFHDARAPEGIPYDPWPGVSVFCEYPWEGWEPVDGAGRSAVWRRLISPFGVWEL